MKVSVSPRAQQELIDGAAFYAERADRGLGLTFIAEFEHARDLLSNNPEIGAQWRGSATSNAPLSIQRRLPDRAPRGPSYRFSPSTSPTWVLGWSQLDRFSIVSPARTRAV